MLKNKKGFSLIELLAVILCIGILVTFAIPSYRTSTMKTRVVNNMVLMRALQDDIVNYYNLHGRLPDNIIQLSLNKGELSDIRPLSAIHTPTRCSLTLCTSNSCRRRGISMDCGAGWTMNYTVQETPLGYAAGPKTFVISDGESSYLHKIANGLNWHQDSTNTYLIR